MKAKITLSKLKGGITTLRFPAGTAVSTAEKVRDDIELLTEISFIMFAHGEIKAPYINFRFSRKVKIDRVKFLVKLAEILEQHGFELQKSSTKT